MENSYCGCCCFCKLDFIFNCKFYRNGYDMLRFSLTFEEVTGGSTDEVCLQISGQALTCEDPTKLSISTPVANNTLLFGGLRHLCSLHASSVSDGVTTCSFVCQCLIWPCQVTMQVTNINIDEPKLCNIERDYFCAMLTT